MLPPPLRVAVVGATGNVGVALLAALAADPAVGEIVGVARRLPSVARPKTRWAVADVGRDALEPLLDGIDVVVNLAWALQPAHDREAQLRTNVLGASRLAAAAATAGVGALVQASSIGAYAAGPKDQLVDERWPATGIPTSTYSRHKADVEAELDRVALAHPSLRQVRLRPALIFQQASASEQRRLFAGGFPWNVVARRPRAVPLLPDTPRLRFQAVHADDVADAYRRAITLPVEGAFNVAADPVIDMAAIAGLLGARTVRVPERLLRIALDVGFRTHLVASEAGWVDLALQSPLIDSGRARSELGWTPARTGLEALAELLEGLRAGASGDTPPLAGGR
jgi:UDP-glucose 4-epimerase